MHGQTAPLAIFGETKETRRVRHSHTRPGRRRARAAHAVKDALTPWHAGYDYDDFADIPAPASGAPARASYRRLQKIKAA